MIIGKREFDVKNRTYIMGILNVTPDSFSDGGKYNRIENALKHAQAMISQGADIIDVGGESTRPGYTKISEEEEIRRVAPVITALKKEFDVPVSVDTYKSKVAKEAICAGADMINDIWGLQYDGRMAEEIAKGSTACCLMHNRDQDKNPYTNLWEDILCDLKQSVSIGIQAGIQKEKIVLDPGIGFAKDYRMNLEVLNQLEQLQKLGYPVLLGTSRKSVIGLTLHLPPDERVEGTLATTVIGVMKGCAFVRVHDVKENKRAIQMTEAILNKNANL